MNILVIHAHWDNHGDEAAIRSMVDELHIKYPEAKIKILIHSNPIKNFDYKGNITSEINIYPRRRNMFFEFGILYLTKGRFGIFNESKHYIYLLQQADLVIHAPGGPSIGDIYYRHERKYLYRLLLAQRLGKPYVFYAPSMGPFDTKRHFIRNLMRKKVLSNAEVFCLREPISKSYVKKLCKKLNPTVTLDSAFQHNVNIEKYEKQYQLYESLRNFIESHNKIVGITITDLKWNPQYKNEEKVADAIKYSFEKMIVYLSKKGYAILFIPQLFGLQHDKEYMNNFVIDNCFIMSENYDCYFQQYVIGKMHSLIGMRYHSNIFSAKMGCPFISIAYEQKMTGFMNKLNLDNYCIDMQNLSYQTLKNRFEYMENHYDEYKIYLKENSELLKEESSKTTKIVEECIDSNILTL